MHIHLIVILCFILAEKVSVCLNLTETGQGCSTRHTTKQTV